MLADNSILFGYEYSLNRIFQGVPKLRHLYKDLLKKMNVGVRVKGTEPPSFPRIRYNNRTEKGDLEFPEGRTSEEVGGPEQVHRYFHADSV